MRAAAALLVLAALLGALAGHARADNALTLTVPKVVAGRLGALLADKTYAKAELVVRQGCRKPGAKEVLFGQAAAPVPLAPFAEPEKDFAVALPDCARDARVESLEVQVRLTTPKGEVAEFSCGADANVVAHSAAGCCDQRLAYRFASCLAADLPRLERSTFEFSFNRTAPAFKGVCKEGLVRVQQYCSPGGATTGEWAPLNCSTGHYELTTPVCVQSSAEGAAANTVTEYSLEYKPKKDAEVQTCFGRSTQGLPDPATVLGAFAGNRRVFVTRAGISECAGEPDARVADTPEDQRKKQEREQNKQMGGGGKATNSSMNEGGSAGKALDSYASCEAVREKDPSAASGVYILTDAEGVNFRAYCEMKLGGGGWMLAFKQSKFGSGSVLDADKALGSADLLNVEFAGSAAVSKSLLAYGKPAELLFVSGADTANNWFTTAALGAYQNWTEGSRLCAYRPKMLKQFRVSHSWDSKKTAIWSDTNVQMTVKADSRASALHIGRYVKNEAGEQCVGGSCAADRHGRMAVPGVCTKGAAGVGDWLVFTRPKQNSPDASKFPLDPVLDRMAGEFISPVHRYRAGSYHGVWSFESSGVWVGDLNGDGLDDYARPGATELRLFISKGNGEFYEPVYPFRNGWNFGWDTNAWHTFKAVDLNGDGRMDIVRASANTLHGILPNAGKADAEAKCWAVAPGTKIPDDCFQKTGWRVPEGWSFSGAWSWKSRALVYGDFNRDGKQDFARLGSQYVHFFISKGDGTFFTPVYRFEAGTEFGFNENQWTSFLAADVDGDGVEDIMRSSGRSLTTFLTRGTNETCWRRGGVISYSCMEEVQSSYPHGWNFAGYWWGFNSAHLVQGDFNGDGKADFARVGGVYTHFFISKGDGYFTSPVYYFPHRWNFGHSNYWCQTLPAADYDGDGRDDLLKSCGRTVYGFYSRGSPDDGRCWETSTMRPKCFKPVVRHYPYGWAFYHWWNLDHKAVGYGDFNGDGKQDWMTARHPHYVHSFISEDKEPKGLDTPETGTYNSFVSKHRWSMSGSDWSMESWALVMGDFNGDGRQDAVRLGRHSMRFFIAKAKPDGDQLFHMPEYKYPAGWDFTNNEHHWASLQGTDLNGDKLTDIVRTSATYNHAFINKNGGARCFERDDQMPDDCWGRTVMHYPKGWGFSGSWTWHSWDTVQGDFDGDGLEDYARFGATYAHFFISKGDGSYYHPVMHYPHRWNFGWSHYHWFTLPAADFDGDGRADVIRTGIRGHHGFYPRGGKECWHHNGNVDTAKCVRTTSVTYPHNWHFHGAWHWTYGTTMVGDYNGDGKADLAKLGSTYIHFFISKGNGDFYTPIYHFPSYWGFWWYNWPWVTIGGQNSRIQPSRFTDMDGDGRSDIIRSYLHYQHGFFPRGSNEECWHRDDTPPSYRPMHCMRITTYWYPHNWWFSGHMTFTGQATQPMDVNGDGLMDFVNWRHPQHAHVFISKSPNDTQTRDEEHPLLGQLDTPVSYYNHGWYFYWHWWMRSRATVTADLNGDGRTDYVRFGHTYMHVFISKGDGTFYQPIYPYPNGRSFGWSDWWWWSLRARDVNGDKRDDLIRAHPHYLVTFMPSGTNKDCWHREGWISTSCFRVASQNLRAHHWGHWHWTSSRTTQGDYNGDGKYDVAFTGDTHTRYYISKGDGTYYEPHVYHGGDNYGWHQGVWYTAGSQDVDSDGQDDVLRLHPRHASTIFSRGSDADCWHKDGRVPDSCLQRQYYTFPHGWNFVYWHVWRWQSHATVLGDFNGDGKMDFARLGSSYSHMFISKGNGDYYSPILAMPRRYHFSWSEYWHSTLLNEDGKGNDLDGDGRTDFARIHARGVYQFYMRGTNEKCWHVNDNWPQHRGPECYTLKHFTFPHRWSFSGWWWNFASAQKVGDFNGDGKTDFMNIVHPRYAHMFLSKPEDHVPEQRPAGEFLAPVYHFPSKRQASGNWHFQSSVARGDFNGDGREDFAKMGDTEMRLFISRGNGTFYTPVYKYPHGTNLGWGDSQFKTLGGVDLNGDARKDILMLGRTHAYSIISEGTNAECWHKDTEIPGGCFRFQSFSYKNGWRMEGSWGLNARGLIFGDFNGDGRDDFARLGGTEARMFISKGDGTFYQPVYPFPRGWNFGFNEWTWTTLPAADFDGDGRADFVRTYHTYNHGFFPRGSNADCWHKDGAISTGCMRITSARYKRGFSGSSHGFNTRRSHVNDYNGDGMADYALVQGHVIFFFISKGDGQFWQPVYRFNHGWNFGYNENYWTTLPTGDYDGDGRGDFVRTYYTYNHAFFPRGDDKRCWHHDDVEPNYRPNDCMQTTTYMYPGRWHFNGGWNFARNGVFAMDLNGDGRTDYINLGSDRYTHIFLAEGDEEE